MRYAFAIASIVLGLAGTAAAQPALAAPGVTPPMTAAQPPPQSPEDEVSENTALGITIGATAASYGMLFVAETQLHGDARNGLAFAGALGTLFAPSTGRWYARSAGLGGLGLRFAGLGTAALAAAAALSECGLDTEPHCTANAGIVLGIVAVGFYAGGTIDDLIMAPRDARSHNARLHQVALVPLVRPDDHGLGVAVAARF